MNYLSTLLVWACAGLLLVSSSLFAQHNIAVFQFSAGSLAAMGLENEAAYTLRNELQKQPSLMLISQRAMEIELARNDITQTFDVQQALAAAPVLNVNYVVIGKVDKRNGQIIANIKLIGASNQNVLQDWRFDYRNQQEVTSRAASVASLILDSIEQHHSQASQPAKTETVVVKWLDNFSAQLKGNATQLSWILADTAPASLGFNLYVSSQASGPFSYLDSVLELSYLDQQSTQQDRYYQLALLTEDGDEMRSDNVVRVAGVATQASNIVAPTVLDFNQSMRGAELVFLPAANSQSQRVVGYQLVRRHAGEDWKIVAEEKLPVARKGKKKSQASSMVKKYRLRDTQPESIHDQVEYGVRAVSNKEKGQVSEIYSHTPVVGPMLAPSERKLLRKVVISWQAAKRGDGYKVYRKVTEDPNQDWQVIATLADISQNEFVDDKINADGQNFSYQLTVFDSQTESLPSPAITTSSRGALPAPDELTSQGELARKVQLRWQAVQDEDVKGYAIYRAPYSDDADVTLTRVATLQGAATNTYQDKQGLHDGSAYLYAIAAVSQFDAAGELSPLVTARTKVPPAAVDSVSVEAKEQHILVSWSYQPQHSFSGFMLERSWQGQDWQYVEQVAPDQFSYSDQQLMAGGEVSYRVSVVGEEGLVSDSKTTEPLASPTALVLEADKQKLLRQAALRWSAEPLVDAIVLQRRQAQEPWQNVTTLLPQDTNYLDETNLIDDQVYQYRLLTLVAEQPVATSNVVEVSTKAIPVPEQLIAQSGQPAQVSLNWQPLQDESVKSYVLYRGLATEDSLLSFAEVSKDAEPSYVDKVAAQGIEHGVEYQYAIASRNVFDVIGPISASVFATSKPLPHAPQGLTANAQAQQITLNWHAVEQADVVKVNVFRKWQHQAQWQLIQTLDAAQTVFDDSQLLPYAEAQYRLQFVDVDQLTGAMSDVQNVTSPVAIILSATNQGLSRRAELGWQHVDGVQAYRVQRRQVGTENWQNLSQVSRADYVDTAGLLDEKDYEYRLQVFESEALLGASNSVTVTTKALPRPPTQFKAHSGLVKRVRLSWQPSQDTDVAGYIVYRVEDDGELNKLETLTASNDTYVDKGGFFTPLKHNRQYQYVVSAFNQYEVEGPRSEIYQATTKALPVSVSQVEAELTADNIVSLTWQPNPEEDIAEYWLYRSKKSCSKGRKYKTLSAGNLAYQDSDVQPGKRYCYWVSAVDKDELEGSRSSVVKMHIPEAAN